MINTSSDNKRFRTSQIILGSEQDAREPVEDQIIWEPETSNLDYPYVKYVPSLVLHQILYKALIGTRTRSSLRSYCFSLQQCKEAWSALKTITYRLWGVGWLRHDVCNLPVSYQLKEVESFYRSRMPVTGSLLLCVSHCGQK